MSPSDSPLEACATARELQIIEASRHLAGSRVVIIGSGAAFAVAPLAKLTTARSARFVLDSGAVDVRLEAALVSVADPRMPETLLAGSMSAVFRDLLAGGRVDASIMSAAQIDATGNLNSSYLGDQQAPTKRFHGAGGAPAMVAGSTKVVIIVAHEKRRFPAVVDYVTCAGPQVGRGRLQELVVVTDLCVLRCTADDPRLRVARAMPGVTPEQIQEQTGFDVEAVPGLPTVEAPSQTVLQILRETVDPDGRYRQH